RGAALARVDHRPVHDHRGAADRRRPYRGRARHAGGVPHARVAGRRDGRGGARRPVGGVERAQHAVPRRDRGDGPAAAAAADDDAGVRPLGPDAPLLLPQRAGDAHAERAGGAPRHRLGDRAPGRRRAARAHARSQPERDARLPGASRRAARSGRTRAAARGRGVSAGAVRPRAEAVALILLRTLVGWHFLYEGLYKLALPGWSRAGAPLAEWSARAYLEGASG